MKIMNFTCIIPAFICMLTAGTFLHAQTYVHHGELANNGSVYFRAEPLNNYFKDGQEDIYYYVHLQGLEQVNVQKKRVPLNLSVVLDRSGSMSGAKLEYTKQALKYLVNQLGNDDILSVVLYESGVEVFLEPQKLEDKTALLKKIDGINTAGSTFMEGGLRKGHELCKLAKDLSGTERINRIILLSDGLANVGISDAGQLSAMTSGFFEKDKISVSTFGVGTDYNEDLMAKIALQSGGKYYFISSPEQLPALFGEELQGISNVVAKQTMLKITFPAGLVYDRTWAYNSKVNGNEIELSFNDFFAREQRSILFRFKRKDRGEQPLVFKAELVYLNAAAEPFVAVSDLRTSEIKFTKEESVYTAGLNRAAAEGYVLEITAGLYDEAVRLADADQYKDAEKKIKEALALLDTHFKSTGENLFLRDLEKKMQEYLVLLKDMKNMDTHSRKVSVKYHKHRSYRTVSCPAF